MMLEKARLKLFKDLRNKNDLNKIKIFLISKDINLMALTMYEIDELWCMFSGERAASFLIVTDNTLSEFYEWLDEE